MRIKDAFRHFHIPAYRQHDSRGIKDVRAWKGLPADRRVATLEDWGEDRIVEAHVEDRHCQIFVQQNDVWCRNLLTDQQWVWIKEAPKEDLIYPSNSTVFRPTFPACPKVPPLLLLALAEQKGKSHGPWHKASAVFNRLSPTRIKDTEVPTFLRDEAGMLGSVIFTIEKVKELRKRTVELMDQLELCVMDRFSKGESIKRPAEKVALEMLKK